MGVRHRGRPLPGPDDQQPGGRLQQRGNVDLTWTGPVSSVSFTYRQDGTVDGDPFIGISDISFQYCL